VLTSMQSSLSNLPARLRPPASTPALQDDTIILHGGGDKREITDRCEQIRSAISTTTSDYDRCVVGEVGSEKEGQRKRSHCMQWGPPDMSRSCC
jgi:hypothetical protein